MKTEERYNGTDGSRGITALFTEAPCKEALWRRQGRVIV